MKQAQPDPCRRKLQRRRTGASGTADAEIGIGVKNLSVDGGIDATANEAFAIQRLQKPFPDGVSGCSRARAPYPLSPSPRIPLKPAAKSPSRYR